MSKLYFWASGYSKTGGRKHLEDFTVGKFEWGDAFCAVFDGHCGDGAAKYARANLWDNIKTTYGFYSDDPQTIKEAIIGGFAKTQENMLSKPPFFLHTLNVNSVQSCSCNENLFFIY